LIKPFFTAILLLLPGLSSSGRYFVELPANVAGVGGAAAAVAAA
jgi:hypothetical protein